MSSGPSHVIGYSRSQTLLLMLGALGFTAADISGFNTVTVHRQRMISVKLSKPESFIARHAAIKRTLEDYRELCGSPVAFPAGHLQYAHDKLLALLNEALAYYKPSMKSYA